MRSKRLCSQWYRLSLSTTRVIGASGAIGLLLWLFSSLDLWRRTVRVMSFFASFALCNCQLEYLRDANEDRLMKNGTLDMLEFQSHVANSLITCNKPLQKKRGRLCSESPQPPRKKVHNPGPLATNTVRYDGYNHWPEHVSIPNAQGCG